MLQRIAAVLGVLLVACVALLIWSLTTHRHGYLAAVFARDGQSIYAIEREVKATVLGFGYEFWTPPAKVRIYRDRFRLINIRLADGRISTVQEFPPSPLEGTSITAYHGAIFGVGRGFLSWADDAHLEYTMSVERSETPSSRTFVVQRQWDKAAQRFVEKPPWQEGYNSMGGSVPEQLSGDLEVIVPPGEELLPCAIIVLRQHAPNGRALVETPACRRKYGDGYTAASMAALSHRADIERSQTMNRTYADLVAQGKARGLNEGAAMLEANKGMEDLGYYPKSPTITARSATCEGVSPVFQISDEEFRVGLFQDIERAIQRPGTAGEKSGSYVLHQNYDTSAKLNAYLKERQDATFYVDGHGGCWQLVVKYYRQ
jgi:hypothetical protein